MPAAVVRGILISIGIIAALGIAVYENPEVQQWVDEQRRKLAILLRNLGDELDPQSRREAEAFAFEGQTPSTPSNETNTDDVALATGRSMASAAVRRIPVQGTVDPQEREERQRLGREYLARRNQQMLEMQERRRTSSQVLSPSASFDSLVDDEGRLKTEDKEELPLVKVENNELPLLESAMQSELFDAVPAENNVEPPSRSETPRPMVPPKIKLEHIDPTPEPEVEASSSRRPFNVQIDEHRFPVPGSMPQEEELSYEDQLALALAISKEDSTHTSARTHQDHSFDNDLRLATEASLQDAQQVVHSHLSDVSEDDLYSVTPNLTRARLATFNAQHIPLIPAQVTSLHSAPEDNVMQDDHAAGAKTPTEASSFAFESDAEDSASLVSRARPGSPERSYTMSEADLIDVEDHDADLISEDGIATPDSWSEIGSHDADSEHATHATPAAA